jgi:hypothetical protein
MAKRKRKSASPAKKVCFVVCPIGEPGTATRKRSDDIFKFLISPVVKPLGYTPVRADKMPKPGIITVQVIEQILTVPLVIADLTEFNANVFYELAIRHAAKMPVVQMIQAGQKIPFDVGEMRTIHVDSQDLASVDEAKKELAAQIESLEDDPSALDSPLSLVLAMLKLSASDKPNERVLTNLVAMMSDVLGSVRGLEMKQSLAEGPWGQVADSAGRSLASYDFDEVLNAIVMWHKHAITADRDIEDDLGKQIPIQQALYGFVGRHLKKLPPQLAHRVVELSRKLGEFDSGDAAVAEELFRESMAIKALMDDWSATR